jgi:hypothetical protein
MKRVFIILELLAVLCLTSCTNYSKEGYMDSFSQFVSEVEQKAPNYVDQDWADADTTFRQYAQTDYQLFKDQLTDSERENLNKLIGKYEALRLKKEAKDFKEDVKDAVNQVKGFFESLEGDSTKKNQ